MLMSSLAISILVVSMSEEIAAWHWREIHPGEKGEIMVRKTTREKSTSNGKMVGLSGNMEQQEQMVSGLSS